MMGVRKLLDYVFSYSELYWLDHIMPGQERIEREDARAMQMPALAYPQVRRTVSFDDGFVCDLGDTSVNELHNQL